MPSSGRWTRTSTNKNRAGQLLAESKPLHAYFFAKLGEKLTPEQVEKVKDKMT